VSTATPKVAAENERYFLVGPGQQVILVNKELFEAVARFTKPQRKFGVVEIVFRNGAICDIRATEHLMNVEHLNSGH